MTRGASNAVVEVDGHKSRHPQPVLHSLSSSGEPLQRSDTNISQAGSSRHENGASASEEEDDGPLHMKRAAPKPMPPLSRAQSDMSGVTRGSEEDEEKSGKPGDPKRRMRHGFAAQLQSAEQAKLLSQNFFMYFEDKRHESAGNRRPDFDQKALVKDWRMMNRQKTLAAILALCLNIGVDPPDVMKTNPCARLECWVEPMIPDSTNQNTANNWNSHIGKNLVQQYEALAMRTKYKPIMDPAIEELKKVTTSVRRNMHGERVLFHYNGHGVPKPTASGEVWCFNRSYTQYIPISLYDLQEWVGAPGLWLWDCSGAGGIIKGFLDSSKKHAANQEEAIKRDPNRAHQQPKIRWEDSIHLAACRDNETLPTNPDLPADVFTCCLTTPIIMAVQFFILQNPLKSANIPVEYARMIPGKVSERRTPLGELNWIFTAITDTIAWNTLEYEVFKKLFRQDLMIAALFRNFLLAQRVMRIYHCRPMSYPELKSTHDHPLWKSWDLAVEMILAQLPKLIEQRKSKEEASEEASHSNAVMSNPSHASAAPTTGPAMNAAQDNATQEIEYTHSDFFADQLSAFEVYLSSAPSDESADNYGRAPQQLPIVLQVLLSQFHRLRALILLSKFLDLGPWAVNLALTVGIFPYVLKLLQSQAPELKPPMVFIWARLLAVDPTVQADLLKDNGFEYFTRILTQPASIPQGNIAEHRAMCAFVIAMVCRDFPAGKAALMEKREDGEKVIDTCLGYLLDMENPLLRQFCCLCLSNMWRDCPKAKAVALAHQAHARVRDRSHDPVPEVRAACLDALTSFVATGEIDPAVMLEEETLASVVVSMGMDGSIMVRKELTVFYSTFIKKYEKRFLVAAWEQLLEERDKKAGKDVENENEHQVQDGVNGGHDLPQANGIHPHKSSHTRQVSFSASETTDFEPTAVKPSRTLSKKTIYRAMWRQILSMSSDPHPEVAKNASIVVDYVINTLLESPLGSHANEVIDELSTSRSKYADTLTLTTMDTLSKQRSRDSRPGTPPSPSVSTTSRADGYFGFSRTASMAASMKNLFAWGGGRTPASEQPPSPVAHRVSMNYKSRPLTPADAASMAPDAFDNVTGPPHQPPAMAPSAPHFVPRDISQPPKIPLKSNFFEWSMWYFQDPQMRPSESDEPGSVNYNERLWRRNRNDKIIASMQPLKDEAGSSKWDEPCGYFGIGAAPAKMVFHQFEDHLVTSDDRDSIAVWNWRTAKQLSRFSNSNPPGSRVTELRFINEDDQAMLMTGSSDGVIKIFKNYDDLAKIELASSFRALSDLVISDKQNAGLVFDWQQGQGRILVAGDDRVIRVWQAGHELCVADIPARSGSCITSLTSDQVEGNVFVAGFGNGSVRVYDQRLSPHDSMVQSWVDRSTDHKSWIVGTHLQRGGLRELISAESNGGIRLWDIRQRKAVAGIDGKREPRNLRALSVHEHAPVFATGGADHTIRVYNTNLQHLSSFEPYMSYLRMANVARHAPITATAFHPHRMMLACGAVNDGHVNLFKCEATVDEKQGGVVDEWKE